MVEKINNYFASKLIEAQKLKGKYIRFSSIIKS